jgi:hypothetical protein
MGCHHRIHSLCGFLLHTWYTLFSYGKYISPLWDILPCGLVISYRCTGEACSLDLHDVSNDVQFGMASYSRRYELQILHNSDEPKHTLCNNGYSLSDSLIQSAVSSCQQTKLWSCCIHLPSSRPEIHPNFISPSLWSSRWSFFKMFLETKLCIYSFSPSCSHIPSPAQPCRFHLQFPDCFITSVANSIQHFSPNSTVKPY